MYDSESWFKKIKKLRKVVEGFVFDYIDKIIKDVVFIIYENEYINIGFI